MQVGHQAKGAEGTERVIGYRTMGGKGRRVFRNMCKEHMDKTKGGRIKVGSGEGWSGGERWGGEMETIVLEEQ